MSEISNELLRLVNTSDRRSTSTGTMTVVIMWLMRNVDYRAVCETQSALCMHASHSHHAYHRTSLELRVLRVEMHVSLDALLEIIETLGLPIIECGAFLRLQLTTARSRLAH